MDNVKKYKKIVTALMKEVQAQVPSEINGVEEQFIFDRPPGSVAVILRGCGRFSNVFNVTPKD